MNEEKVIDQFNQSEDQVSTTEEIINEDQEEIKEVQESEVENVKPKRKRRSNVEEVDEVNNSLVVLNNDKIYNSPTSTSYRYVSGQYHLTGEIFNGREGVSRTQNGKVVGWIYH